MLTKPVQKEGPLEIRKWVMKAVYDLADINEIASAE
jgi:hypothetical protein